ESLEDRLQPIGPRGKVRQHVHAVRICGHAAREARVGLGRGDRDAGDDGAAFVGDAAAQLRRRKLRPRCDTGDNEDEHADEQNSQKCPHWRSPLQGDGVTTHDTEGGCSTRTRWCQRNRESGTPSVCEVFVKSSPELPPTTPIACRSTNSRDDYASQCASGAIPSVARMSRGRCPSHPLVVLAL